MAHEAANNMALLKGNLQCFKWTECSEYGDFKKAYDRVQAYTQVGQNKLDCFWESITFISDELETWLICHFVDKTVQKKVGYKLASNF